jgi:hypothetical protein
VVVVLLGCGGNGHRTADSFEALASTDLASLDGDVFEGAPIDLTSVDSTTCEAEFRSDVYAGQCLSDGHPDWGIGPSPIGVCNEDKTCCREVRVGDNYLSQEEVDRVNRYCGGPPPGSVDCYRTSDPDIGCAGGCYCVYCYKEICIEAGCIPECLPSQEIEPEAGETVEPEVGPADVGDGE